MARTTKKKPRNRNLPKFLRPLFWEYDFEALRWPRDTHLVTSRILAYGDLHSFSWLRRNLTGEGLRRWSMLYGGRGLDPPRLRYWELLLDLPKPEVDRWIEEMLKDPWHRRTDPSNLTRPRKGASR
jgi:hypothetical protein